MQVIILAAGSGSRLGAKANGLPKCLLQVGGEPLVEHQLRALADAGASPVLMVIGYAADLVEETVRDRVEKILNPRYDKTNSLYSLWLARSWIRGPVIIMNSDILFDRRVVEALVKAGPDHLAYDSHSGHAAEHMKVRVEDGIVRDISKTLSDAESSGENVGMIYLSETTARRVMAKADEFVTQGRDNTFWADALRTVLPEVTLRAVDVTDLPWIEIDSPYDLDRARRDVWPEISGRTGRVRGRRLRIGLAAVALAAAFAGVWFIATFMSVQSWESLGSQSGHPVKIVVGGVPQDWYMTKGSESVTTPIAGPRTLRIDVRGIAQVRPDPFVPYVVEVSLDGKKLDLHKFTARPKPEIKHPDGIVCDRDKIEVVVPEGEHTVSVRPVAGDIVALLVRFKVLGERE